MSSRVAIKKEKIKYNERSVSESILLLFPLFLIVIVLPLIIKMRSYHSGLNIYDWFTYNDTAYDTFLYYKQWFFVGVCGLIILIILGRAILDKKTLKFNKIFIPIIIYAVLAYVSTLFSKYKTFGFSGSFEQFENVFCLIGYVLVAYYTFIVIQSQVEVKLMMNALAIGLLIVNTIGALQSIGLDILNTPFMKSAIVGKIMDPDRLTLVFGKGRSYATLYNPNYVGVLAIMTISVYTVMLMFAKKKYEYVLYSLLVIMASFSMFGAQFKSGLVYIVVVFVLMIVLLRKVLKQRWFVLAGVWLTMLIAFFITNTYSDNAYVDAINGALGAVTPNPTLTQMDTLSDGVSFTYNGNYVKVTMDKERNFTLSDANGLNLEYELAGEDEEAKIYVPKDSGLDEINVGIFSPDQELDFYLVIEDSFYVFMYDEESKAYLYYNRYGRFSPIKTADSVIFTGREAFGSGRGYIWSRTLPLLKDYLFLGSGADSFVQVFPQYDYIAMKNFGFGEQLITKPHCIYLQIGVQTGVLSLIAYLVFFAIYAIQSLIIYFKNDYHSPIAIVGVALFMGIAAYMLGGVSNDSIICIAPVFWVIVGLGLLCNHMVKTADQK